jgi:hypothetical protein
VRIVVFTDLHPPCENCEAPIMRKPRESPKHFARRRFCDRRCARSWQVIHNPQALGYRGEARLCPDCGERMKMVNPRGGRRRWRCPCGRELSPREAELPEQRARRLAAKRRRLAVRAPLYRHWLAAIKAHTPCADCGGSWPAYVMHFDHVRGKKVFGLGQAGTLAGAISIKGLVREIEKCDVVCANCHALRHEGHFLTPEQERRRDEHNDRQREANRARRPI